MTGCGTGALNTSAYLSPGEINSIKGHVDGGQGPIGGATITVYDSATNGYGSTSYTTPGSTTTTDSGGNFTLSAANLTCTAGNSVFVAGTGGYSIGTTTNSAIVEVAVLGICPSGGVITSSTVPYIVMNEVSTVAAIWSLQQFYIPNTGFGTSSTNAVGLKNATNTAANLYYVPNGGNGALATTPGGNGTPATARINTLANIMAACVNTTGPTSPACTTLFDNTRAGGSPTGTLPTTIERALYNLATNPAGYTNATNSTNSVTNLFALQSGFSIFTPAATSLPEATIGIAYQLPGNAYYANYIAIDSQGNILYPAASSKTLYSISPLGVASSSTCPTVGAGAVVIGPGDVAYYINSGLYKRTSAGVCSAVSTTSTSNSIYALTIANYGSNAGYGDGVPHITGTLALSSSSGSLVDYTANKITAAYSYALEGIVDDPNTSLDLAFPGAGTNVLNVLVVDDTASGPTGGNTVTGASGAYFENLAGTGGSSAIGSALWIVGRNNNTLYKYAYGTNVITSFTGSGLNQPFNIAVDGNASPWITLLGGGAVSHFTNAGVGTGGSDSGGVYRGGVSWGIGLGIATDPSGNVWLSTYNSTPALVELVGAAAPTYTPIGLATYYSNAGTKP